MMWSGFDLRPRNLFDRTPFYPYTPEPARPLANQRTQPGASEPSPGGAATAVETPRPTPAPERRK